MKLLYRYLAKKSAVYFIVLISIFSILVISSQMLNLPSAIYHINIFRFIQSLMLINLSFFKIQLLFSYSLAFLFLGYSLREQNQIYAIYSSGISKLNFLKVFFLIGILASLTAFIVSFFIVPYANKERVKFITTNVQKYFLESINPRNFTKLPGDYIIYVSQKKKNNFYNTMIYNRKNGFLITAKRAVFDKSNLVLFRGILQLPGKKGFTVLTYDKYVLDLKINYKKNLSFEGFSFQDLVSLIKTGNKKEKLKAIATISERIGYTVPFVFFSSLFFFLGLGIKKDRDFILGTGIFLLIVYLSINYYMVKLIEKGIIFPLIYFLVLLAICVLPLIFFYKKV